MSEKPDPDDYEDDDAADDGDATQLDHLIKDLEASKRRASPKGGEPAWRRLEKYAERKRTAELLSDIDDYEIFDERPGAARPKRPRR